MILIYGKGKVGNSVKNLLDFLKIDNIIMDDFDRDIDFIIKNKENIDFILPSPGIKPNHDIYKFDYNKIIGEIDLVNFLINKYGNNKKYIFIGITGTDGKSTATRKTYNILKKYLGDRYNVYIGGNFDRPVSDIFLESLVKSDKKDNIFVLEVSSFMAYNLKHTTFFSSFWTNFDIDHLDRHKDIEDYWNSKMNLFNLTVGLKIPNINKKITFKKFNTDFEDFVIFLKELLKNLNVDLDTKVIKKDIEEIPSLPHRFQLYKKIGDIFIYDDGKCTTAQCQEYALKRINGKCVLIAGGYDKGIDYSINSKIYKEKVGYGIFFGNIGKNLEILFKELNIDCQYFSDFDKAIIKSLEIAKRNKINNILFSPGASSFDMFKNRKERVNRFLDIINSIDES